MYARDARGRGGRPSFHLVTHTLEKKEEEEEEGPGKKRAISQMPKDIKIGKEKRAKAEKRGRNNKCLHSESGSVSGSYSGEETLASSPGYICPTTIHTGFDRWADWIGPIDFLLLLGTGLPPNARGGGGRDRTVYARISRESIQLFKTFLSGRGAL